MLWHDDFFTLRSGQTRKMMRFGRFENHFIIQHPYFHFGSSPIARALAREENDNEVENETQVYFQQYEISSSREHSDISDFLLDVEKNYHLKPDYYLWYETGFWTAVLGSSSYMGMGLNTLREMLEKNTTAQFAVCLSNAISVALINSKMGEGKKLVISVYASNDISPFVEVIEPFRKAIDKCEDSILLRSEILLEEKLRRFWGARRRITVDPVAFVIKREHDEHKILPVIRSPFSQVRDPIMNRIRYIMGTASGGFIESDYYSGKQFLPYAEIWDLASASIVEFHFQQVWQRRALNTK